jgi:hypothetical protein
LAESLGLISGELRVAGIRSQRRIRIFVARLKIEAVEVKLLPSGIGDTAAIERRKVCGRLTVQRKIEGTIDEYGALIPSEAR